MRIINALKADMMFQVKQGFYAVYLLLTIMYTVVLSQIPAKYLTVAVPFVVFSDPTIVGFFFIGGIVMLEKSQGVLDYLIVTPLRSMEYLISKVISLSILAVVAGVGITAVTYGGNVNWLYLVLGILLSSIFFTLYGFIPAAGCRTVNQYFLRAVPYMLFIILPCFSLLGFKLSWLFNIFPSVAGLKIVLGAFNGIGIIELLIFMVYIAAFDVFMFYQVKNIFDSKIAYGG